ERHRTGGPEVAGQEKAQDRGGLQARPSGLRQDTLGAAERARSPRRDGAEQSGGGAPGGGGGGGEQTELGRGGGRLGGKGGEGEQQGQGQGRYTVHAGLLARGSWVVVVTPRIPPRRPVWLPRSCSRIASKSA